jgi:hypothetical protein
MGRAHVGLLAAAALLAGCAHKRPQTAHVCPLRMLPVDVAPVPGGAVESGEARGIGARSYAEEIRALSVRPTVESGRPEQAPAPIEHLVLSGGGKWGAFGAGFLERWVDRPVFTTVTGVSTGALQSSLAFIADENVQPGKVYPEALDFAVPPLPTERGFIDDLVLAYSISRSETIVTVLGGEVTALRKGAAADLGPLRLRLDALLDDHAMQTIADQHGKGRRLFVGLVDMDDGRSYAVDMTDLALKWSRAGDAGTGRFSRAQLKDCYLDVLMAASSEPLSAFPVFVRPVTAAANGSPLPAPGIETRMFMDAGIRNGVFLQEVLKADGTPKPDDPPVRFNTSVIVNGTLSARDRTAEAGAPWATEWSLLSLVGRAKEMLVDQIYQFSVDRVKLFGAPFGTVRLATAADYETHMYAPAGATCEAIRVLEKDLGFPPTFMKCLIDYGASRWLPGGAGWNHVTPTAGTATTTTAAVKGGFDGQGE